MQSAYLKNTVGPVLAKAVAETVVAQPGNPQEYLALCILHHIQEEERRETAVARRQQTEALREAWQQRQAVKEQAAVQVIGRHLRSFLTYTRERRAREAELEAQYNECVEDAEASLEAEEEQATTAAAGDGGDAERERAGHAATAAELAEALHDARATFFKAQAFMHVLDKSDFGLLKRELVQNAARVRVALDALQGLRDAAATEERLRAGGTAPPQALYLEEHAAHERDHRHISIALVNYHVLRVLCYLLLDATPRATETPAKVAALLKPSVVVALLRAFDPVDTYNRSRPLRLVAAQGRGEADEAEDAEGGAAAAAAVDQPQPSGRQARRARRVLRICLSNGEYQSELDPETIAGLAEAAEEDASVRAEVAAATASFERAQSTREAVLQQTKSRGGVVLAALLRYLHAAMAYRAARDTWVHFAQENGIEISAPRTMPAEEEETPNNDEALFTEDGEADVAAVRRLQDKIGVDTAEDLAKIFEAREARLKKLLEERAAAYREQMGNAGDDEEDEG